MMDLSALPFPSRQSNEHFSLATANRQLPFYTEPAMIRTIRSIPLDRIRLLIFDLDGTLVDSQLDLAHSINAMLRHYHRAELPVEIISGFIGDGAPMLVRRALGDPDNGNFFREALDFFIRYYREHKLDNTYVYAGMKEALQAIQSASNGRIKMAVLTNKPVIPSKGIVEGLGLKDFFFEVYGGNSFPTKKPDPQGAQKLMEEAGVSADEAVMIGDSHNDTLTAKNAGMWSIGCAYGLSPESLQQVPPDMLIDHPAELVEALGFSSARKSSEIPSGEGFSG
jgi:phosphoglycolate phosphatase